MESTYLQEIKRPIGKAVVETVASYRCEVWTEKQKEKNELLAVEMCYMKKGAKLSRMGRNTK
jgi:hypothetical protein